MVQTASELTWWTVLLCRALWGAGSYFSWENPWMSMLWWFQAVIQLYLLSQMIATVFKHQEYDLPWKKATFYLHNYPTYHEMDSGERLEPPTAVLTGKCSYREAEIFRTQLSQTYPIMLEMKMGELAAAARWMRAQALAGKRPVPKASRLNDHGLPSLDGGVREEMFREDVEAALQKKWLGAPIWGHAEQMYTKRASAVGDNTGTRSAGPPPDDS